MPLSDERIAALEALLRRWVVTDERQFDGSFEPLWVWFPNDDGSGKKLKSCCFCQRTVGRRAKTSAIVHTPGCIVGDTLKVLEVDGD